MLPRDLVIERYYSVPTFAPRDPQTASMASSAAAQVISAADGSFPAPEAIDFARESTFPREMGPESSGTIRLTRATACSSLSASGSVMCGKSLPGRRSAGSTADGRSVVATINTRPLLFVKFYD